MKIDTIYLPTRPQPDTIVAIFLLRTFGAEKFPNIERATVEVKHILSSEETFDALLAKGILAIDVGGGMFDHHDKSLCASELVARAMGVEKDPALARLLQYARRDDVEGKGTLSTDPVDRAFGLSGLIASLNKMYITEPQKVVDSVLPLLEAQYQSSKEHHVELPAEVEEKKRSGQYKEVFVSHGGKRVKVVFVVSDKPSMPAYLRSQRGARADVVVQKSERTNHLCVLSQQQKDIDLSMVAALIRLREGELIGKEFGSDPMYLGKTGRIDEAPFWYFDPATKSLLNGGPHNTAVEESHISWDEMQKIVSAGLEMSSPSVQQKSSSSYFLSVPIPHEHASRVLGLLTTPKEVKVHDAKNVHITLHYLGVRTPSEVAEFAEKVSGALANTTPFSVVLKSSQLRVGAPEGQSHAWYLDLSGEDGVEFLESVRSKVLDRAGIPEEKKQFHITLATKRDKHTAVADTAVSYSEPFEIVVPVREIALVESSVEGGKRVYKDHTVFSLT